MSAKVFLGYDQAASTAPTISRRAGRLRLLIVAPGLDHFEIPETLARPDGLLGRASLALMGLT